MTGTGITVSVPRRNVDPISGDTGSPDRPTTVRKPS